MAKLDPDEIARIVQRDMPGYRVSTKSSSAVPDWAARDSRDSASAESASGTDAPRYDALRSRYLGDAASEVEVESSGDAVESASDAANGNDDDAEIVAVEPEQTTHPWDRGARPKAAVISTKRKKVIGQQG